MMATINSTLLKDQGKEDKANAPTWKDKLHALVQQAWLVKHGVPIPPPVLTAQQRAEVEECFEMLDTDGSGAIDVRELVNAFGALGFSISKSDIEELMLQADPDGSGELEFDEFLSLMGRALYHPDINGRELVANTGSGSVSFADAVRAFRRKKLIESLIRGGDARLKVVAFHEKVQELIKAETEELRQRQATHAIYERMETARAEQQRTVKAQMAPSQRAAKVKARLQEAISRSLGVFETLFRDVRHARSAGGGSTNLASAAAAAIAAKRAAAAGGGGGGSGSDGSQSAMQDSDTDSGDPLGLGSRSESPSASRPSSPPGSGRGAGGGGGGGVTFLTQSAGNPLAGALRRMESLREASRLRGPALQQHQQHQPRAAEPHHGFAMGPIPLSRSASMNSVDSTTAKVTRRVSTAVLRYFKQLEEASRKQEQKYDEAARMNAVFIAAPPERSDFLAAIHPARPLSRAAHASAAADSTAAVAAGFSGSLRGPSPKPGAQPRVQHPHAWRIKRANSGQRRTHSSTSANADLASAVAAYATAYGRLSPPPTASTLRAHGRHGGAGGGGLTPPPPPRFYTPEPGAVGAAASSLAWPSRPATAVFATAAATAAAVGPGGAASVGAACPDPRAAAPALDSWAAAGANAAPSPSPLAQSPHTGSRAWRQAPAFGPSGSASGPNGAQLPFGWGAGGARGAALRRGGGGGAGTVLPASGAAPDGWPPFPGTGGGSDPGTAAGSGAAQPQRPSLLHVLAAATALSLDLEAPPGDASDGTTAGASHTPDGLAAPGARSRSGSPGSGSPDGQHGGPHPHAHAHLGPGPATRALMAAARAHAYVHVQVAPPAPASAASGTAAPAGDPQISGGAGGGDAATIVGSVPGELASGSGVRSTAQHAGTHTPPPLSHASQQPPHHGRPHGAATPDTVSSSGGAHTLQASAPPPGGQHLGAPSGVAAVPGHRTNSFSHGPFRPASRTPGELTGPAAAALVEGLVTVRQPLGSRWCRTQHGGSAGTELGDIRESGEPSLGDARRGSGSSSSGPRLGSAGTNGGGDRWPDHDNNGAFAQAGAAAAGAARAGGAEDDAVDMAAVLADAEVANVGWAQQAPGQQEPEPALAAHTARSASPTLAPLSTATSVPSVSASRPPSRAVASFLNNAASLAGAPGEGRTPFRPWGTSGPQPTAGGFSSSGHALSAAAGAAGEAQPSLRGRPATHSGTGAHASAGTAAGPPAPATNLVPTLAARSPSPATYGPRGAYMSLALRRSGSAAGAGAGARPATGGGSSAQLVQLRDKEKQVVVVSYSSAALPVARNGTIITASAASAAQHQQAVQHAAAIKPHRIAARAHVSPVEHGNRAAAAACMSGDSAASLPALDARAVSRGGSLLERVGDLGPWEAPGVSSPQALVQ